MSERLLRLCVVASFILNIILIVVVFRLDAQREAQIKYMEYQVMDKLEWIDLNVTN